MALGTAKSPERWFCSNKQNLHDLDAEKVLNFQIKNVLHIENKIVWSYFRMFILKQLDRCRAQ